VSGTNVPLVGGYGYTNRTPVTAPTTASPSLTGTPALNTPVAGNSSSATPGIVVTPNPGDVIGGGGYVAPVITSPPAVASTTTQRLPTPSTPTPQTASTPTSAAAAATTSAPTPPAAGSTAADAGDIQRLLQNFLGGMDNPLNSHWQVAYHWQLFCISDIDLYTQAGNPSSVSALYNAVDKLNKIVVAESGVTTYSIKSVEMDSLVGPNYESRNINATKFTINIIEPIGVGFLDALKQAALQNKIRNLQYAPYYLQLSFKAYVEKGAAGGTEGDIEVDALTNAGLNTSRWIWQIQITDVETHFDEKGGNYTLTAIPYNENVIDSQDTLTAPQTMSASGGTISAFFDDLGTNLTNAWTARNGFQSVTYKFMVHDIANPPPSVSDVKIGNYKTKPQQPNNSSIKINTFKDGSFQAIFSPGTVITDMIDWPLHNNEQIQNLGLDRDNTQTQTDQSTQNTNDRKFKESIIFRVETDINVTGYDYWNSVYIRTITFHIFPYYTQAIIASVVQRNNARDPTVQASMLKTLLARGLLKKNYQYLFTGLNTEVLNMEIKSSFKWAALLPKLEGARMSVDNIETAAKAADAQVKQAQNATEVPDLRDKLAALAQSKTDIDAAIATQKTQNQAAITPEVEAAIQTLSTPGSSIIQRAFATATLNAASPTLNSLVAKQQNIIATAQTLQTRLNAAQDAQLGIGGTQTAKGTTIYAEDLIVSNTGNVLNTEFDYENFNYSVPFRQAYKDQMQQTGTGLVGPYHRDRSTFGSLIEQLYEPYTTQLANVDLDIRGDPYWIGQSNLQRTIALRLNDPNGGSQSYSPNQPNWVAGDQVFMFTFRYPIVTGNDFVPIFRNDDSFIGIYRATQITSYFSDGIFKQKLHGILYPLINVINAINNLNNAASARPSSQKGNTTTPRPSTANPTVTPARVPMTQAQQQSNASDFKAALLASAAARGLPLTDAQADGIVANAYRESAMNPTVKITDTNGLPAAGLLQWNGPRYENFNTIEGVYPQNATIQQQADYTIRELANQAGSGFGEPNSYRQLATTTTGEQATSSFLQYYERGRQVDFNSNLSKSLGYFPNMYGPGKPGNSS